MKTTTFPKLVRQLVLLLTLAVGATCAYAQGEIGVLGKIDRVMMDEHYIVIDGKRMVVRDEDLVITYKGEPVIPSSLAPGQTVRYRTREDGSVSELMLIGPSSELDQINNH